VVNRSTIAINMFLNPEEGEEAVKPPVPEEILAIVIEEVVRTPKSTPKSSSGQRHSVDSLTEPEGEDEEELYYALSFRSKKQFTT